MKAQFVQYWGCNPLWRELTAPYKKIYFMWPWAHKDSIFIGAIKGNLFDRERVRVEVKRGEWVLFTAQAAHSYTSDQYKQLLEI